MSRENKTKPITIRFPQSIYKKIEENAFAETRSINEQVLHYVKLALKELGYDQERGGQQIASEEQISSQRSSGKDNRL